MAYFAGQQQKVCCRDCIGCCCHYCGNNWPLMIFCRSENLHTCLGTEPVTLGGGVNNVDANGGDSGMTDVSNFCRVAGNRTSELTKRRVTAGVISRCRTKSPRAVKICLTEVTIDPQKWSE